jgi:hypothetical protein
MQHFSIYTTVFLCPLSKGRGVPLPEQSQPLRDLRGFTYSLGHNLPLPYPLIASSHETNLDHTNSLTKDGFFVTQFEWTIPALAKRAYQQGFSTAKRDYKVTRSDVAEFAAKAHIALYCGGDKPFAEIVPAAKQICFDGETYQQVISDMTRFPLSVMRLSKFWTVIAWHHSVFPNVGGVIPVRLSLHGVVRGRRK